MISYRWELKKIEVHHPPRSFASLEDDTAGEKQAKIEAKQALARTEGVILSEEND